MLLLMLVRRNDAKATNKDFPVETGRKGGVVIGNDR
jgi:hypothetical protein